MKAPPGLGALVSLNLILLLSSLILGGKEDRPPAHSRAGVGAEAQDLAPELHLQWVRELPPLKPAWPDQARLQFDVAYQPAVRGKTLFVGSSRTDDVTAYDTETGAEKWRFSTDGPVRFAPAAWQDRVYFVSDDGYLYCVDGL